MVSRETEPLIEVRELSKRYGQAPALHSLSMRVTAGEILCLLGPSGSGKSTLLRCIAGLEIPDAGEVRLRGQVITTLPPHRRGFGMMFQQFALFPHRTVGENVAFGLKMQGVPPAERARRVQEMLELVSLEGFAARTIFELSGGEQQRVALARSLAPRPQLLMLDEPLGSLDRGLRERLMDELRDILKGIGMTALYVTHDQQEAFAIADRLLLLQEGQKVQEGPPEELYRHPATRFAADFFGLRNHLEILQLAPGPLPHHWRALTPIGWLQFISEGEPGRLLLVRPEAARLAATGMENEVSGLVRERSFRGGHYRLVTEHESGHRLEWEVTTPERDLPPVGAPIRLSLRPDAIGLLPTE